MKFTVHFTGLENTYAINILEKSIGFTDVDFIREYTLPDLRLDPIIGYIEPKMDDIFIDCEEDYARQCPHFKDNNRVGVKVSEGLANKYCYKKVEVFKDLETEEIEGVRIILALDEKKLLKEWAALGYPLTIIEDK